MVSIITLIVLSIYTLVTLQLWQETQVSGNRVQQELAIAQLQAVTATHSADTAARELVEVGKQATASQQQVGIMQKQFENADRPWVSIDAAFTSPLTYRNGVQVEITFIPKNVGKSPAEHIRINAQLVPALMWDDLTEAQKRICENVAAESWPAKFPGYILFPDKQYTQPIGLSLSVTELDGYWAKEFKESSKGKDVLPLALVGCVDYTFESSPRHHQTGFAYDVVTKDGGAILISTTPMEPSSIILRARLPGNYFAN